MSRMALSEHKNARATAGPASNPSRLLQRKCSCGAPTASLTGKCPECQRRQPLQRKPAVELQRQEAPKEKTNEEKYQEGLAKMGEAFLQTPLGKALLEKIRQDTLVKGVTNLGQDFISTWPGKIVTGAAATGAVAALAATHKELPVQIPEIPLDALTPGLSVRLTYKGPVDQPTEAMITFKYTEQVPKSRSGQRPLSEAEKFRAETARLATEAAKFRASMTYPPGSPEDLQQKAEQEAIRKVVLKYSGGLQLTMPRPFTGIQSPLQKKLSIGASNDLLEQEADRVADQVIASPSCSAVSDSALRIQRLAGQTTDQAGLAPISVDRVLSSPGSPLEPALRQDMERRFDQDFSAVRIHTGQDAERSAQEVNAHAYTVGKHIVFGRDQLQPEGHQGRHLIAHELVHVLQQGEDTHRVQRDGMGDLRLSEACAETREKIRLYPAYKALDPASKNLTEDIIAELEKHPPAERYGLLTALENLFTSKQKLPATISTETNSSTTIAVAQEQTRLANPVAARNTGIEENGSRDPKRAWTPIKGKFGGGTYYVDRRSATDIHVKADIYLHRAGTGTAAVVTQIKGMEDAIEKAASTKGYIVDIRFVASKDADAFDVEVDPSKWEVATNWSGGDPLGFAHELHHLFAFELDRYNYIASHATNDSMQIDQRLFWFREELRKPANYNDPTSIMDSASHPNDSDACTVSGIDMAACMAARQKMGKTP